MKDRKLEQVSNCHQITQELKPTALEIFNDSHKHAHHKAMVGVTSRETHFRYVDFMLCLLEKEPLDTDLSGLTISQGQHRLGCFQVKNAASKTQNGIHLVEG